MSQEAVTRDLLDRYARLEAIVRDLKIKQANYRADTAGKLGGGPGAWVAPVQYILCSEFLEHPGSRKVGARLFGDVVQLKGIVKVNASNSQINFPPEYANAPERRLNIGGYLGGSFVSGFLRVYDPSAISPPGTFTFAGLGTLPKYVSLDGLYWVNDAAA
jgi:hypothetical protein